MVWRMPDNTDRALRDLIEMRRIGVEAVRTNIIRNGEVLSLADTMGIDLYVDLPFSRLAAERLRDTLQYATAVLDTVLGLAQIHPSIRHIGLARYFDATDSTACDAIARMADHARRQGPPGTRVYYLTRFTTSDRCRTAVDLVLLDLRDREDPLAVLRKRESPGQTGVGSLGISVRSDTLNGLRIASSPEAQARYFERHLPALLSDTLAIRPPVVFVHSWRDVQLPYPTIAHDLKQPYVQRYGLHTMQDVERPAYDVIKGVYTGRQTTFAFRSGDPPPGGAPWSTLFGWTLFALIGAFYALSPRFRHMVPRYFGARFFYRDAVREGRDVLFGASTVLLIALSAAFGLVTAVILDVLRTTDEFVMAARWLPEATQDVLITLLAEPYVLIVLSGCTYAVAIIVWTILLSLLSRRRYPIAPGQALMLVIWPRWPLLLVMLASIVVASMADVSPLTVLILAACWFGLSFLAVVRTLIDFILVTRVPAYMLLAALVLNPGMIVAGALAVVLLPFEPELRFLWNVATKP